MKCGIMEINLLSFSRSTVKISIYHCTFFLAVIFFDFFFFLCNFKQSIFFFD